MRPYFAIVRDSFREALGSPVLWIVLAMVTCLLVMLAPLGYHEVSTSRLTQHEVHDWEGFVQRVSKAGQSLLPSPGKRLWTRFDPKLQQRLIKFSPPKPGDLESVGEYSRTIDDFIEETNEVLTQRDFYDAATWKGIDLGFEGAQLAKASRDKLTSDEVGRFNRILLERAYPEFIEVSPATSTVVTYAVWDLQSPMPIRQEQFHKIIQGLVNAFNNWFMGGLGVLIAILITAPIIPRMFDQGQLHLLLSKPVTRSLLFVSQFLGGCAYITIVATYLIVGMWLILGFRFQMWDARFLWLIPIYTFVFAIYYSVSALTGVVFRNSIVSIAASMLFWLLCFTLGTSKLSMEEMFVNKQRLNKLVPAGEDLLAVNEQNQVFVWDAQESKWQDVFVSNEQKQLRSFSMILPPMPPMVGPVYDAKRAAIFAVERSFSRGGQLALGIGKAQQNWSHNPGVAPPIGTFAILQEPQGTLLFAGNLGLFRLQGDPLKAPAPVKVLGIQLPLPPQGPFVNAAPELELLMAPPSAVAVDPQSGGVIVYTRGKLKRLSLDAKHRFISFGTKAIDAEETESVTLAYGGNAVVLGRKDGRVQVLRADGLAEQLVEKLEPDSTARFITAAPGGQRFACLFQNGKLWLFDAQETKWSRATVTGQGNISAVSWSPEGDLLVADRTTRVSVYQGKDLELQQRYAPSLSVMETAYHYGVVPLYTILPKPGELYKTFEYILSGKSTASELTADDASIAQKPLRPWAPVWSGLAFVGVVLLITCIYFERQEY